MNNGKTRPLAERFWAKVDCSPGYGPRGDCWRWIGTRKPNGYGQIGRGRSGEGTEGAHRVAFFLSRGYYPVRPNEVCHTCDVRDCVNPDHLWEGTRRDNLSDMTAKGRRRSRYNLGERHHNSKLLDRHVIGILTSELPSKDLARIYGVSYSPDQADQARR